MTLSRFFHAIVALAVGFVCTAPAAQSASVTLTVMTHDSFSVSKEVVANFEKTQDVSVRFLKAGDAGAALNQAILSRRHPLADVFFGVDNTFLSRALKADIFLPYDAPGLAHVDDQFKLDPENRLLPVDYGDVCLNYDKAWFSEKNLPPPAGLEDLIRPPYKGLAVVQNPATSSPGMAFLLATVGRFGDPGYRDYWKALRKNGVLVVDGWKKAYWGHFTAASDGDRPIVVSYATSPPAEVHFAETPPAEAPTAAVTGNGAAFRQIEFVGILKGTAQEVLARKWVDFMLELTFQEDIPLQMWVFPVRADAKLPDVFVKYAKTAEAPATVAPDAIDTRREQWLDNWTRTMLR